MIWRELGEDEECYTPQHLAKHDEEPEEFRQSIFNGTFSGGQFGTGFGFSGTMKPRFTHGPYIQAGDKRFRFEQQHHYMEVVAGEVYEWSVGERQVEP